MSDSTVAIIGSGIAGTTIAYHLTRRGHDVTMFEIGPDCPYPHTEQYHHEILNLQPSTDLYVAKDLRGLEVTGNYKDSASLPFEQVMVVGGMATRWSAWTPRYLPRDFKTHTLFGYGVDWPITYDDLEPFYCRAESLIGVSGTDEDNPLAPWRSQPYPLPPFEFGYDDQIMYERLKRKGIHLHTVPQARVSRPYDGRPGCANFGVCQCCPIGARYSPNHHLELSRKTGLLTLHSNTAVRRILAERPNQATTIVYYPGNDKKPAEHHAKVVILAAGALESARLLLLSTSPAFPNGLGNNEGHVGQHLLLNHGYGGRLFFKELLYPGRIGPRSAQSYQLREPRNGHGGFFKIDFASSAHVPWPIYPDGRGSGDPDTETPSLNMNWRSGKDVVQMLDKERRGRSIGVHAETTPSAHKYVALSNRKDRFGDPFALVRHESNEFDHENRPIVQEIVDQFAAATGATEVNFSTDHFNTGHHHLGTCRMSSDPRFGVVDSFGQVNGMKNLFVAGASIFPASSPANPTITIVALAIRTAEFILDQVI